MASHIKTFTVKQANKALPYIARIIDDVIAVYKRMVKLRNNAGPKGMSDSEDAKYNTVMDRMNELVDELLLVGVLLKDYETGLVDFPAWRAGKRVYLCWKHGEKRVAHWHHPDEGMAARKPVSTLRV